MNLIWKRKVSIMTKKEAKKKYSYKTYYTACCNCAKIIRMGKYKGAEIPDFDVEEKIWCPRCDDWNPYCERSYLSWFEALKISIKIRVELWRLHKEQVKYWRQRGYQIR